MKFTRWLTAIFIVTITVLALGFAKFQQIQAAMAMAESFPEPSATVNSITTTTSDFDESHKTTGQVSATQIVQLQNEMGGIITQVNFSAGQTVEKGQLLLAINTVEEEASLDATKANLELAQSNFSRIKKLLKQNKVSQQEFDSAKAQVKVNQANIANLKAVIGKKRVYAPFSGIVGLDTFQTGQFISPNSIITTLVGIEPEVWIDFQLAQTQRKLAPTDQVWIKPINAEDSAYRPAKIIAKNSLIKAQSRHMKYRAELLDGRKWYEHNEIVDIKIVRPNQSVILVPNSAVNRNQNGDYLFILEQDDNAQYRAHRVEVELGKRYLDKQIIKSGIEEGQFIATEGAFKLREGLLVYPLALSENTLSASLARLSISGE